jgi:lauroyl/myristoyl acyltransferase
MKWRRRDARQNPRFTTWSTGQSVVDRSSANLAKCVAKKKRTATTTIMQSRFRSVGFAAFTTANTMNSLNPRNSKRPTRPGAE